LVFACKSFAELDMRVRSNIPSVIRLPDYTAEQSFDIINNRAEKA
jgi:Cdc6-like AAA superfamily ATPase